MHGKSVIEAVPCIVQAFTRYNLLFQPPAASDPDRQQASPHRKDRKYMTNNEFREAVIDDLGHSGARFLFRVYDLIQAETPGVELLEALTDLIEADDREALERVSALLDSI